MNPKRLEQYARFVWPVQRHLTFDLTRRCRTCIVSDRFCPFGDDGICSYCKNADGSSTPSFPCDDLDSVLDIRGTSNYDALLMLSGGKDSAYILQRVRQDYPDLRLFCLVVHNGFMSNMALSNAVRCVNRANVDYRVDYSRMRQFTETFREAFLSLGGRGASHVVDYADGKTTFTIGEETARRMSIPLVLSGLSPSQVQMIVNPVDGFHCGENPKQVFPLAVWKVPDAEIVETAVEAGCVELSPLATNSDLIWPMFVIDFLRLGYSSFEPEFAQQIREGRSDRTKWLNIFQVLEWLSKSGRLTDLSDSVLKRLGLTTRQLVKEAI